MKINIYRIDKELPLPKYETAGAVGFDFICRETINIAPQSLALISANVIIEVPQGYMLAVVPRSSTPKKGLFLANSIGIIDNDYCGPNDEIKIFVYNYTQNEVIVQRGDRIAQGIIIKIEKPQLSELSAPPNKDNRNGFGSTG